MVIAHDDRGVLEVALVRPDRRNALTPESLAQLTLAVGAHLPEHARCILLYGQGRAFCAGFDLDLCRDHPDGSMMRALLTGLSEAVLKLRLARPPVVIAVHGAAVAGGCALLGGADFVVADRAAKIGYPVVRMGISPAVSGPFLRLAIGDGRARERMLDHQLIDAVEAHRLGLVHELVATPDEVLPRARAIARELAEKPPYVMAMTRAWLNEIDEQGGLFERTPHRQPPPDAPHSPWIDPRGKDVLALEASLSLTGGAEEQTRLALFWAR